MNLEFPLTTGRTQLESDDKDLYMLFNLVTYNIGLQALPMCRIDWYDDNKKEVSFIEDMGKESTIYKYSLRHTFVVTLEEARKIDNLHRQKIARKRI